MKEKVKRYPLRERKNRVKVENFARVPSGKEKLSLFMESLPRILGGKDFCLVIEAILKAYRKGKPVIWAMGAHVIKCGLSPLVIELMRREVISLCAMNGAGAIHDFEVALIGETSEDVEENLAQGRFGMARETGKIMNEVINKGAKEDKGMGKLLGEEISRGNYPYKEYSILAQAFGLGIPVTVHVAIGADILHQHPEADGSSIGKSTFLDFQRFVEEVRRMEGGGVYLNVGSAVILPEVFLKALNLAKNLNPEFSTFTTVNMDMIPHYRPRENVVRRPQVLGGEGYSLIGQHEILIPLIASCIMEKMEGL